MAQRLEQPAHAPGAVGRAEQDRHPEALPGLAREVVEHLLRRRSLIHQQLLEQLVVMIGKLFEHVRPRLDLALLHFGGDLDWLGLLAGAIFERTLEREVDEPADLLAIADGDLPSDQRRDADRLQRRKQVADSAVRLVDAVDEDEMRNAELIERPQRRGGERRTGGVRIDDDDRGVGDGQRSRPVGSEADRAGHIDDRELSPRYSKL